MKHVKSDSALHRFGELFTRNFGLKLLSLALAILIYEVLKPRTEPTPAAVTATAPTTTSGNNGTTNNGEPR